MPPKDEPHRPTYSSGSLLALPRVVLEERQRKAASAHRPAAASAASPPASRPHPTTKSHAAASQPLAESRPPIPSPSRKRSVPSSQRARAHLPSKSSRTISTLNLRNDRLGTLVNELSELYANAPSWSAFVESFRGRSYLAEQVGDLPHPAAPLLAHNPKSLIK